MRLVFSRFHRRFALLAALCMSMAACSGALSPATGSKGTAIVTTPTLRADPQRRAAALSNWGTLTAAQGINNPPAPELDPATSTIRSLPQSAAGSLRLPKVGSSPIMSEDDTREALRRFITSAGTLIGAQPQQLSLLAPAVKGGTVRDAEYRQRPLRFPVRGGYGRLSIRFDADRHISEISSTCIPDIGKFERLYADVVPRSTPEQVASRLAGHTFAETTADAGGRTFTPAQGEITVGELVIYPRPRANDPVVLEMPLAWEVKTAGPAPHILYVDAVTDEIIAASPFTG